MPFSLKRIVRCVSTLALAVSIAAPGAAHADNLMEALALAYETNPTLRSERANLRATDEVYAQARAGGLPQVSGSVDYSRNEIEQTGGFGAAFGPERTLNSESYTIGAEQLVFSGLSTWNSVRQARAQIDAGRASLVNTEQAVLLDSITAYMDVLRDEATVELNNNNVAVLKRQLQASRDRFEVGEITRTDVAQSEARLKGAEAQLIGARAQRASSRAAYTRVIGRPPGSLDEPPALPVFPETEEEARLLAFRYNPQLVAARASELASRRGVAAAKGALSPSVTAFAQFSDARNQQVDDDQTETTAIGGRLNVPLFLGGANHSRVRQAKHQNSRDRLLIVEAERAVAEGVSNAWESLLAASATLDAAQAQADANEIALDGVRQEAQVGSRTTLDVLNAEQEFLDSQVALVRAERDEYVAGFQLLSAFGGLTAQNLDLGVEIYDPERNFRRMKWVVVGFSGVNDG